MNTTIDQLLQAAREAGRVGDNFGSWCNSDTVQDFLFSPAYDAIPHAEQDALTAKLHAAFEEGLREHRRANGWVTRWTTAPKDYDTFATEHVSEEPFQGKTLREVLIDPDHVEYQTMRYGSGCHGTWGTNPRVEYERRQAEWAQVEGARKEHEAKHAAGLEWLKGLTIEQLEDLAYDRGQFADGEALQVHALSYSEARAALRAKRDEVAKVDRAKRWAECRALIPDGCILVDDGENRRTEHGAINRPSQVYYNVRTMGTAMTDPDPDRCDVLSSSGDLNRYKLSSLADDVRSGRLRVARPEDVPPQAVLDRIGHSKLKEIKRYEIREETTVWVGRAVFGDVPLVLDKEGHIVRRKAIHTEAIRRWHADGGW